MKLLLIGDVVGKPGRAALLDRLQDSLASKAHAETKASTEPNISAPMPQLPKHSAGISASDTSKPQDSTLDEEARGLAEILRNQSHPTNLVAVRRDQTPVLESPSVDGKVLFLASAEDEFEIPEWIEIAEIPMVASDPFVVLAHQDLGAAQRVGEALVEQPSE